MSILNVHAFCSGWTSTLQNIHCVFHISRHIFTVCVWLSTLFVWLFTLLKSTCHVLEEFNKSDIWENSCSFGTYWLFVSSVIKFSTFWATVSEDIFTSGKLLASQAFSTQKVSSTFLSSCANQSSLSQSDSDWLAGSHAGQSKEIISCISLSNTTGDSSSFWTKESSVVSVLSTLSVVSSGVISAK